MRQACAVCRFRADDGSIDLPALLDHLSQQGLSRKKWPEHLVLVDSMAVTAIGKLDKKGDGRHRCGTRYGRASRLTRACPIQHFD
tara:strand:- start:807 stop:1061 length:255 start_codon:yes stop_codon:yes gene_type:complete